MTQKKCDTSLMRFLVVYPVLRTPPLHRDGSGWNNLGASQFSGWREERERLNGTSAADQQSLVRTWRRPCARSSTTGKHTVWTATARESNRHHHCGGEAVNLTVTEPSFMIAFFSPMTGRLGWVCARMYMRGCL